MSLLFSESPIISLGVFTSLGIGIYFQSNLIIGFSVVLLVFLLYFYRYCPIEIQVQDNEIVSPCEGTVLDILDRQNYYYIPIFLSPFNRHTQIYPANCTVLKRIYDRTGEYNMVMNLNKSVNNEKKIHYLLLKNGAVIKLTQIAGFLPRMITSDESLTTYSAGDYLGMIKFGSRVDLLIPKYAPDKSTFSLNIQKNQKICIGDYLGDYSLSS